MGRNSRRLLPPAVAGCQTLWQQCLPKIVLILLLSSRYSPSCSSQPPRPHFLALAVVLRKLFLGLCFEPNKEQIWLMMQAFFFFLNLKKAHILHLQ